MIAPNTFHLWKNDPNGEWVVSEPGMPYPTGSPEYIRRTPAALAGDELVLAMIGAVVEEAAKVGDRWKKQWSFCSHGNEPDLDTRAGGITFGRLQGAETVAHFIRALRPDATAALAAHNKRIRDATLEEAAAILDSRANAARLAQWDAEERKYSDLAARIRALKDTQP